MPSKNNEVNPIPDSILKREKTAGQTAKYLKILTGGSGKARIMKALLLLALLIVVIVLLIPSSEDDSIPVFLVKKDNFLITITESGEISAKEAVSITTPRVRGNIKIVYLIPEGTYVKPGDVVVQFDPTEALNNLKDAEAKLEVALSDRDKLLANHKSTMTRMESDLKGAELTFELSKLNLEQMKFEAEIKQQEAQLQHKRNELSFQKAKQDLESQKIIQKSELNKVDIDIQQRRNDLEKAQRDLEMLTLTAPKEGLVVYEQNWSTGRKIAIGDTPWPGMTLITLPDLSTMQSITYVNEVDVSRVQKGQKVLVTLDAFRDSTFTGEIASVASLGRAKDGNSSIKVFEIFVTILSQSEILKPGMTTSNRIIVNEIPSVLFVPHESVFDNGGSPYVFVKNGSGFEKKKVKLGAKGEDFIIITEGIKENDEVALVDPTVIPKDEEQESSNQSSPGYSN